MRNLLPFTLIVAGSTLILLARRISTFKSNAWTRFYRSHPKAAEVNPLAHHAGSEKSIALGAFMWRLGGVLLVLNGLLRLSM